MRLHLLQHKLLLASLAVGVGLAALAFWPKALEVDTAPVARRELTVTLDEEGTTRVHHRFLISAPVAGRSLRIELDPGDPVVKGQTVLARLLPSDPTPLDARAQAEAEAAEKAARAALDRSQAEVKRAGAAATLAAAQLARTEELARSGLVATEVLDSRRAEAETSTAARRSADFAAASARQELAMARARLGRFETGPGGALEISSPIDGVVLRRLRESEAAVPAGDPLLELGDPAELEIVADYLSIDAVRIRPGQPVRIEQWGGDAVLEGRVQRVEPSGFTKVSALGVEEQRVNVIIDFVQPREAWKALGDGYRVEVRVVVWQQADTLTVPVSALFRQGKSWAVFRLQGGRARVQEIALGPRNDLDAQVLSGLAAGERVILHPPDTLQDGGRAKAR